MHFHLCLTLTCVFAGITGAKELFLVESDCVRAAVKPNLQAEEGFKEEVQLETTDNYIATSAANIGIDIQLNIGSG